MKTCRIVGAGDFAPGRFCPAQGDYVIAADAGYRHLERLGIVPDLIIGDFDSLGSVPDRPNVEVCPVKKDDTDMLIAVRRALDLGFERLLLFGGTGGRMDHTLANIQTLGFAAQKGAEAFLMGDDCTLTVLRDGTLRFEGYSGGFSVFSLGDAARGVTETGTAYPLLDAKLTCDFPLGVSNAFEGPRTGITVREGLLVVFWSGNEERPLPARR